MNHQLNIQLIQTIQYPQDYPLCAENRTIPGKKSVKKLLLAPIILYVIRKTM